MRGIISVVGGLLLWLVAGPSVAADTGAAGDLAAIPSSRAQHALLLDVAWAGKRLVAVGERGHIVLSDDAGQSWHQAPVPVRTLLTSVTFPTPRDGWAVGHDGVILHSADGGDTWAIQRRQPFDPDAAAAAEEAALADAEAKGVDVESDEGIAIGIAAASRVGAALLDAWFSDAQHGFVVGANGTFLETTDGGRTWLDRSASIDNPDGWHLNAIAVLPSSPNVVVIAGEKGMLFRSQDGGRTFAHVNSGSDGSWFGVMGVGKDFFLFGLQGHLLRSSDGGKTWRSLASGVTSGLNDGVVLADGSVAIAGNAGVVVTIAPGSNRVITVHRADRQTVASAARIDGGLLLVGEGGAKRAKPDGQP